MIMGAGKTTMIMPLIALALADGTRLIVACVPGPLLDMSATVLRSRFGFIFPKLLSYLSFDRQSGAKLPVAIQLYNRVISTASAGGVLMTTPEAIKSLFLKFVELQLDDANLGVKRGHHDQGALVGSNPWFAPNELLGEAPGWSTPHFALDGIRVVGCLDTEAQRLGAVFRMELSFSLPLPRDGVKLMHDDGQVAGEMHFSLRVKRHHRLGEGQRLKDPEHRSHDVGRPIIDGKEMRKGELVKWGDSALIIYARPHREMEGEEGLCGAKDSIR